jgi:hypothetical protein
MSRRITTMGKVKKYLLSLSASCLVMFMQFLLQSRLGIQPTNQSPVQADHAKNAAPELVVETPRQTLTIRDHLPATSAPSMDKGNTHSVFYRADARDGQR